MYFGNILTFVSLATLFGASKGNKVVNEVNKHLENLNAKWPAPRDCKRLNKKTMLTRGCTHWPKAGEKPTGTDTPGYDVDFNKGRYASLGNFHNSILLHSGLNPV